MLQKLCHFHNLISIALAKIISFFSYDKFVFWPTLSVSREKVKEGSLWHCIRLYDYLELLSNLVWLRLDLSRSFCLGFDMIETSLGLAWIGMGRHALRDFDQVIVGLDWDLYNDWSFG